MSAVPLPLRQQFIAEFSREEWEAVTGLRCCTSQQRDAVLNSMLTDLDAARAAMKQALENFTPRCRYIISGSEGQCQERATHVVRTAKNKYPMEVCELHMHTFTDSSFKVTKLTSPK